MKSACLFCGVGKKLAGRDYVAIFTLLPYEKFNLDRIKLEQSKKEDVEQRCNHLIRTVRLVTGSRPSLFLQVLLGKNPLRIPPPPLLLSACHQQGPESVWGHGLAAL